MDNQRTNYFILPSKEDLDAFRKVFTYMSESYKLFWFYAIIENVEEDRFVISFESLIDSMIVNASELVMKYNLTLGPKDTLGRAVKRLFYLRDLNVNINKNEVKDALASCHDDELYKDKNILTMNVPFRFQSPFLKASKKSVFRNSVNDLAKLINEEENLIYYYSDIDGLKTKIVIQKKWCNYFQLNASLLRNWAMLTLKNYLEKKNPNVKIREVMFQYIK